MRYAKIATEFTLGNSRPVQFDHLGPLFLRHLPTQTTFQGCIACVFPTRARERVIRIAARRIIAPMTNPFTFTDRAVRQFESNPMDAARLVALRRHPVIVGISVSLPFPATGFCDRALGFNSIQRRKVNPGVAW